MLAFFNLQLGTVHLCRSVIRSIETARIFDFEEFPQRDKVTTYADCVVDAIPSASFVTLFATR